MRVPGYIDKVFVILKRFYGSKCLPYSIIFLGILLHMRHYLFNRCLWVDECMSSNQMGEEGLLRSKGVEIEVLQDETCIAMMRKFINENPKIWNEDIGV